MSNPRMIAMSDGFGFHQLHACPPTREGMTAAIRAEIEKTKAILGPCLPLRHQGIARCGSGPIKLGEHVVHFGSLECIGELWVYTVESLQRMPGPSESILSLKPVCPLSEWGKKEEPK